VTQFAKVKIRVEPFDGEQPITIENKLKPGTLPPELEQVLEETVHDAARSGGVVGYPLMKVRLTLLDASHRAGETTELAIQAAASEAVHEALNDAGVVLLEPIMRVEILTPDEFLGNIQADLNARRAVIVSSERRGNRSVLEAQASLANMFGYSTRIRSLSRGLATHSMEPLKYDTAPPEVLKGMMG